MASTVFAITPSPDSSQGSASAGSPVIGVSSTVPGSFQPLNSFSSAVRRSANGIGEELVVVDREHVEGAEDRRGLLGEHLHPRLGRVQAVLEQVEDLAAVVAEDQELAVEDVAALGEDELGEVAGERLRTARLQVEIVTVDERERAEAVVLRLVGPVVAVG